MATKYPTWTKGLHPRVWVSEEQMGGVPDFVIYKESSMQYRLDHRTSACPTYHPSLAAAKAHAEGV